ncbi:hypothetical protein V1512DRAFT_256552 [Lipomyces arxii]|uniref:uncharacterized protein n=1 Tax=Lipomyces arxii TaxID=56418 RepID=UPI0034CE1CFC
MPVVALAKLFPKEGKMKELLEVLRPEAEYVYSKELTTSAYYFFIDEANPNVLYGFERYESVENAQKVHMTSAPFNAFVEGSVAITEKPFELEIYEPANIGFLSRPVFSSLQSPEIFVLCVTFIAKPGKGDYILNLCAPLAKHVEETELTTYSYYFTSAVENKDKIMVFERYATRDASQVIHSHGEFFVKTFKELMDADVLAEPPSVLKCSESGIGFLGRD